MAPKKRFRAPDEKCDISGLAEEWDVDSDTRKRLRDGGPLLDPMTIQNREDIKTCALNFDLLAPLLIRVGLANRKLPTIDDLRDQIATILHINKRQGQDALQLMDDSARHIKKLLVFVKNKARRHEVSTATRPKQT